MINLAYIRYIELERGFANKTVTNYLHYLEMLDDYAEKNYNAIDKLDIEQLKNFLIVVHNKKYGTATKAQIISIIKSYYKFLQYNDIRGDNPAEILHYPKKVKKKPAILYENEILLLIDNIDTSKLRGKRNKAIITIIYSCGLRVSELTGLECGEINYFNKMVRVFGKGNKYREVPINSYALEVLSDYMNLERDELLKGYESKYVFAGKTGNKMATSTIRNILNKEIEKTSLLNKITPHTLRHSFATHLLNSGMDVRLVQDLLGHENISTTEVYTHLSLQKLKDKYDELELR